LRLLPITFFLSISLCAFTPLSASGEQDQVAQITDHWGGRPGEFDLSCAPKRDGVPLYKSLNKNDVHELFSSMNNTSWSFNIAGLYEEDGVQMASGFIHNGKNNPFASQTGYYSGPIDMRAQHQLYIRTMDWDCELFKGTSDDSHSGN